VMGLHTGCDVSIAGLLGVGAFELAARTEPGARGALRIAGAAWYAVAAWAVLALLPQLKWRPGVEWATLSYYVWIGLSWVATAAVALGLWRVGRRGAAIVVLASFAFAHPPPFAFSWNVLGYPRVIYAVIGLDAAQVVAMIALARPLATRAPIADPERARRGLLHVGRGMHVVMLAAGAMTIALLSSIGHGAYHRQGLTKNLWVIATCVVALALIWVVRGLIDVVRGLSNARGWLAIGTAAALWCAGLAAAQALQFAAWKLGARGVEPLLVGELGLALSVGFIVAVAGLLSALQQLAHERGELALYMGVFNRRLAIVGLLLAAAALEKWGLGARGLGDGQPVVFALLWLVCKLPALGMAITIVREAAELVAPTGVPAARLIAREPAALVAPDASTPE